MWSLSKVETSSTIVLWAVAVGIVVVPGSVITRIWRAIERLGPSRGQACGRAAHEAFTGGAGWLMAHGMLTMSR
jgi:hypothetical protein